MTILPREQVRAAVERALALDGDTLAAAEAVAQALCLPVETVHEVIEERAEA